MISGMLKKLFGTPLFIKPLSDEEALIAELALDTMKIDFSSPKKLLVRKKVEKEAVKVALVAKAAYISRALEPPLLPYIGSSLDPSNIPTQAPTKKMEGGQNI